MPTGCHKFCQYNFAFCRFLSFDMFPEVNVDGLTSFCNRASSRSSDWGHSAASFLVPAYSAAFWLLLQSYRGLDIFSFPGTDNLVYDLNKAQE